VIVIIKDCVKGIHWERCFKCKGMINDHERDERCNPSTDETCSFTPKGYLCCSCWNELLEKGKLVFAEDR
jgi:hypothetical protein